MWSDIKQQVVQFKTAVINGRDGEGYPTSARTLVRVDEARQVFSVDVADELQMQPGPASLLLHTHDEQLWNQHVVRVRGELIAEEAGWTFRPSQFTLLFGGSNPFYLIKAILDIRKTAKSYLRKRGLERPQIPWDKLKAVKGG